MLVLLLFRGGVLADAASLKHDTYVDVLSPLHLGVHVQDLVKVDLDVLLRTKVFFEASARSMLCNFFLTDP